MKKENKLEQVAKSYDRHFTKRGKDYDKLPEYITSDPDYPHYKKEVESDWEKTRRAELIAYLSPAENMNFIQLGCSLNLKFRGYDQWPSVYHGVDISNETIQWLQNYVSENKLSIGSLYCGSVHETPYADSYFDIGECIGVLEYYEKEFVLKAIQEFHRLLKPNGRIVLDIPNITSSSGRAMMLIEEYMGRPDQFNMLPQEFEDMIQDYFIIEDSDSIRAKNHGETHTGVMYFYCLRCKK